MQTQRDRADGAYVRGDVLTGRAIATRGSLHQFAIFIQQAHRQTIKFQLAAERQCFSGFQAILHAFIKCQIAFFIKYVVQR
ncbi:hypothetical protein SRABI106_03187 [Rahnella aquatilis]|nr:hypothetical protein SRABI106_03187 [Rahnella aquatilis]